ncbi:MULTISPECIES: helix-turn-helix domain-containing protein [Streptacidiphilus]|uniref:Winged helix-turn-helix transcriptional regulator n=2 Tax=Streptacidiphilus TaxID=228398 RepID=A0ABV6UUN0_9ACTN|nr:helix-turn-helix domain-containing protein [Streptacidiphilus jeojiense]
MDSRTPRPGVPVRGSESGRPVMAALDLLGRRWALRILWELSQSPAGFRELQRRCERMSSSVLNTRLNELTDAGLLTMHGDGYQLTRLGEDLVDALRPLNAWSQRWADENAASVRVRP